MAADRTTGEQWGDIAGEWIRKLNGEKDPHRDGLLDPWVLDAIGEVAGLRVIDLGCGEGRFGRVLAERDADVVGIDFTPLFVEYANAHAVGSERYLVGDMADLSEFPDESFDLAVSYVSLVDVPDFLPVVREAYRVLRPAGRFVVSNLQPMVTAANGWLKDERRNKLHFRLDNYFDEGGAREMPMCGGVVTNFHHTLSCYVNGFLAAGFRLDGIREPKPSDEQLTRFP